MSFRLSPARAPAVGLEAMVATSQPSATLAGLQALRDGGSAADAAICAAAVLCVAEPEATGPGGDLFAIVRDADGTLFGLDAAGPAPASATPGPPHSAGPASVDVPGAVDGWGQLSDRFGRLGLERCLRPAAELARDGLAAGANCARMWASSPRAPREFGVPPRAGERFVLPALAQTLDAIGREGPRSFYEGPLAAAITDATWLSESDLAGYRARWVTPLRRPHHGLTVAQLPAPTQGVAVLEALGLIGDRDPSLAEEVWAVALALEDALATVRDGGDVTSLLTDEHLDRRRSERPGAVSEPGFGTVCVCAVDGTGQAVSLMQSLYEPFGSGVVAGATGIVLNNRAACFAVSGEVDPGRRPYHTLIPGMITGPDDLVIPFGVMGGFIQAQAETQFVCELLRRDLDPQAALDRGRFRLDGAVLSLEEPLWEAAETLSGLPVTIERTTDRARFGGGQAIVRRGGTLAGGSDARKDGCALGY
jgi:gamma-glutamyltranspeptidase/glutathione hydrolase